LNEEIAALESQIRDLGARLDSAKDARKTGHRSSAPKPDPVFESIAPADKGSRASTSQRSAPVAAPTSQRPDRLWPRLVRAFRPAQSANPRLINYLAAGSIQGLRPLRYERRVARNRVVALSLILLFIIWGLVAVLQR
jgi:hypothetical protein